jgi:hypothetical protein
LKVQSETAAGRRVRGQPRRRRVDLCGQRREVHVRGQLAQRVADLVQFRLALLFREQTDLDHLHFLMPSTSATSCQGRGGFSRCPRGVAAQENPLR